MTKSGITAKCMILKAQITGYQSIPGSFILMNTKSFNKKFKNSREKGNNTKLLKML